jgi:hypothetical protein
VTPSVDGVFYKPAATVQMVVGTAGASYSTNIMDPQPPYTEFVSFTHGFAHLTFVNDSAAQWRFVNDTDGSIVDQFWLLK